MSIEKMDLKERTKKFALKVIRVVEEEADETIYWMELLIETGLVHKHNLISLLKEK